jgi:acylglycerol lipase
MRNGWQLELDKERPVSAGDRVIVQTVTYSSCMENHASAIEYFQASDGRQLALRRYVPVVESRADVVILHGIISHSGWYDVSSVALAGRGFDVHALDRRGSGLNGDVPGDIDSMRTWFNDVIDYLSRIKQAGRPLFLLGISWGGKLAPAIARARPDLLTGFGMLCPGIYARQQPGLFKRFGLGLSGRLGVHRKTVSIPLQEPELFTDSPRWQAYIRHDPLTLRRITLRFARQDWQLTRHVRSSAPYLHLPSLLVLAGRDRIVDNLQTKRYFTQMASGDKTLLEYSNCAHTLEFEADVDQYINDLAGWLGHQSCKAQ